MGQYFIKNETDKNIDFGLGGNSDYHPNNLGPDETIHTDAVFRKVTGCVAPDVQITKEAISGKKTLKVTGNYVVEVNGVIAPYSFKPEELPVYFNGTSPESLGIKFSLVEPDPNARYGSGLGGGAAVRSYKQPDDTYVLQLFTEENGENWTNTAVTFPTGVIWDMLECSKDGKLMIGKTTGGSSVNQAVEFVGRNADGSLNKITGTGVQGEFISAAITRNMKTVFSIINDGGWKFVKTNLRVDAQDHLELVDFSSSNNVGDLPLCIGLDPLNKAFFTLTVNETTGEVNLTAKLFDKADSTIGAVIPVTGALIGLAKGANTKNDFSRKLVWCTDNRALICVRGELFAIILEDDLSAVNTVKLEPSAALDITHFIDLNDYIPESSDRRMLGYNLSDDTYHAFDVDIMNEMLLVDGVSDSLPGNLNGTVAANGPTLFQDGVIMVNYLENTTSVISQDIWLVTPYEGKLVFKDQLL